jgi:hypothetical protein
MSEIISLSEASFSNIEVDESDVSIESREEFILTNRDVEFWSIVMVDVCII